MGRTILKNHNEQKYGGTINRCLMPENHRELPRRIESLLAAVDEQSGLMTADQQNDLVLRLRALATRIEEGLPELNPELDKLMASLVASAVIERGQPQDLHGLIELEKGIFEFPWNQHDVNRYLKTDNEKTFALVVKREDVIIGALYYSVVEGEAWLDSILVHQNHRDEGYGSALLHEAFKHLSSCGYEDVMLRIRGSNETGKAFFLERGFQFQKEEQSPYDVIDENAYILVKSIQ